MSRLSDKLRGRTKRAASDVIARSVSLRKTRHEVHVIGHQLLRSGLSIAAHVREALHARSDAEFCSKSDGPLQEAYESLLWLKLLKEDGGIQAVVIAAIHVRISETLAVFANMVSKVRREFIIPSLEFQFFIRPLPSVSR